MAIIRRVNGIMPQWGQNCFFADNSVVVGDVTMGDDCSVWFNAVVRGDVNSIIIGNKCNIQDGAVIHCTYQKSKTILGNNVSIGHNAIIHGCQIEDNVLIGMGAIVMDRAIVQSGALVAAGAVVLENTIVEAGYLYAGVPAKKIKLVEGELKKVFENTANQYVMYAGWFKEEQ
jgi:carbonic anhydrase/acetyltransferase-like protein (isoleucine patch superfamily)